MDKSGVQLTTAWWSQPQTHYCLNIFKDQEVDPPLLKETKSKDLEKLLLRKSPNIINDHSTNRNEAWEVGSS